MIRNILTKGIMSIIKDINYFYRYLLTVSLKKLIGNNIKNKWIYKLTIILI